MRNLKVEDGKVEYLYQTFDGSYVSGYMTEAEAKIATASAKEDNSMPGYELVKDKYRFATEEVVMKFKKSSKEKED